MHLVRNHHKPITLWVGMYAITACLFIAETGDLTTGLTMGLLSASLKTVWSVLHSKVFGSKPIAPGEVASN